MVQKVSGDTIFMTDTLSCVYSQNGEPLSNWFNWVSLIAFVVTLICFAITCYQIYQVKSVSKQVKDAVDDNNKQIRDSISLSTVTNVIIRKNF